MIKLPDIVLVTALALIPIYIGSSGGMQIAHVVLLMYFVGFLFKNGLTFTLLESLLFALFCFVLVRESYATILGSDPAAILFAVYLAFNLLVVTVMRRVVQHRSGLRALTWGLLLATAVAVAGVLVFGYGLRIDEEGGRAVGTFNNPNQLGYFSVCMISIAMVLRMRGQLSVLLLAAIMIACIFLAMASLSKAAMLSVAGVSLISGYSLFRRKTAFVVGTLFLATLVLVGFSMYDSGTFDGYAFVRRLQGIGTQGDDSLEGRGYNVITQMAPLEVFFGLGSKQVRDIVGHEVHSTFFSFVANYGAIGGLLMAAVLFVWMRAVYRGMGLKGLLLVVVAPMLYGITHNGSRFTMFWLMVAVSLSATKLPTPDLSRVQFQRAGHASTRKQSDIMIPNEDR